MPWTYPCAGHVTSPFGPRILAAGMFPFHYGVDLAAGRGPVYAAQDGIVRSIWVTFKGGWVVDIRHAHEGGKEIRTRYIHMFEHEIRVEVGQRVKAGDQIGNSGESGSPRSPHLHFEVLVAGVPVNPVPFMAARGVYFGTFPVSNLTRIGGTVPGAPNGTLPDPLDPEDDMTPEQANQLANTNALALEARNLSAHVINVLAGLPTLMAKAVMWDTTVARNVDGVDTKVPVIQEIADIKTRVLGLPAGSPVAEVDEAALAAALAPLLPQVVVDLSDEELLRIGQAIADEHHRRLAR